MSKCEQVKCEQPAAFRMHWPGKSLDCCKGHRKSAHSIAAAMGLSLSEDRIELEKIKLKPAKPITDPTELCAFICLPFLGTAESYDEYKKHEERSVQAIEAAFAEIRAADRRQSSGAPTSC